nr:hypothetical protein Q903MT_gene3668 [Picea sitchensis]
MGTDQYYRLAQLHIRVILPSYPSAKGCALMMCLLRPACPLCLLEPDTTLPLSHGLKMRLGK